MATPQTPQTPSRGSVLKRYTPFIAVIVVLAVVVLVIALVSGGDDDNGGSVSTNTDANGSTGATDFSDVPIFYNEAKEKGTLDDYTWQDNCDTETGEVAIPILNPPPCVPAAEGVYEKEATPPEETTAPVPPVGSVSFATPKSSSLTKLREPPRSMRKMLSGLRSR